MLSVAAILVLALTRAEIIERMKAPVVTQCDGLVQVYADCPEDMRREFQSPVAGFAAGTVKTLYEGLKIKSKRYPRAGIIIHIGDVRTNLTTVVAKVSTNDGQVVSRLYLKSPGYADLDRFKLEVVKAFCRGVKGEELDDVAAIETYRKADPKFRIADERARLADWVSGRLVSRTPEEDEENLKRMRKVITPGVATPLDIRIFASRLYLYPLDFASPFCGRFDCLSFREAVACAKTDPFVRLAAYAKAGLMIVYGGGRSPSLAEASRRYYEFLLQLAKFEKTEDELLDLLDAADAKLNEALEEVSGKVRDAPSRHGKTEANVSNLSPCSPWPGRPRPGRWEGDSSMTQGEDALPTCQLPLELAAFKAEALQPPLKKGPEE